MIKMMTMMSIQNKIHIAKRGKFKKKKKDEQETFLDVFKGPDKSKFESFALGTSPVVQWLRCRAPNSGGLEFNP